MGMSFAAFIFFLLVPTAPPWCAEQHGAITGVTHLLARSLLSAIGPYYQSLNADPVAAFPSLHAAFPFLGFLALRRTYPCASWIAFVWCLAVWFCVVFLGEHYGVDVVAVVGLAGTSWIVMTHWVVPQVAVLQSRRRTDRRFHGRVASLGCAWPPSRRAAQGQVTPSRPTARIRDVAAQPTPWPAVALGAGRKVFRLALPPPPAP